MIIKIIFYSKIKKKAWDCVNLTYDHKPDNYDEY